MSDLFIYITTSTTVDPYVPQGAQDLNALAHSVSDAFVALSGGFNRVGRLEFFPLQRAVPGALLCDGKEVAKASFPQLYSYLGDTQGTPVDPDNFVLPDYIGGTIAPAATADTETVVDGSATAPPPTDPDIPAWDDEVYAQWDTGGKPRPLT